MTKTLLGIAAIAVAGCQVQDPNTPAPNQPGPAPAAAPAQNQGGAVVGQWRNDQAGLMMQLAPNGSYQMQARGQVIQGTWAIPQAGVIVFTVNGQATTYRYSAQGQKLGLQDPNGQQMWFARVGGGAAAQPPVAGGAPATKPQAIPSGPFPFPARYRNYNAPIVAYFSETLSRQTPASVAHGLRNLSPAGKQSLTVYTAFANQLHYFACQADPSFVLYNWQGSGQAPVTCAANLQQWQNTAQLTNGSTTPTSCVQCQREAFSVQIAFRCTVGDMSRQQCNQVMSQIRGQNNMDNQTMNRIISNMPGNGCVCGDPNCSC